MYPVQPNYEDVALLAEALARIVDSIQKAEIRPVPEQRISCIVIPRIPLAEVLTAEDVRKVGQSILPALKIAIGRVGRIVPPNLAPAAERSAFEANGIAVGGRVVGTDFLSAGMIGTNLGTARERLTTPVCISAADEALRQASKTRKTPRTR